MPGFDAPKCRVTAPLSRRAFGSLAVAGALAGQHSSAQAVEPPHDTTYCDDFDELWETLRARYCYFQDKTTDWNAVRSLYRPRAIAAQSDAAFADIVRQVFVELYDSHCHLEEPAPGTPFWPPYDLLVEPHGSGAQVIDVYANSAADNAGIRPGDFIVAVNNESPALAATYYAPKCLKRPDPRANRFAMNAAVGGLRGLSRKLTIEKAAGLVTLTLPTKIYPSLPDLEFSMVAQAYGLITIRSFGGEDVVTKFDAALNQLAGLKGLIIDVRYNGGGDTEIARPIMGRFIAERRPYAMMRRREGSTLSAAWTEYVDPRGPFTYTKPVIVLCGTWSASMAEGFPMGMRDIGRATVVGRRMMGLSAAIYHITLDRTGIVGQYSAEPVYDTHGVSRAEFLPDITVPPSKDSLGAAIGALAQLTQG